jgi:type I restriction enzyme S subunit
MYGALYFRDQREKLISLAQGAAQTNISQQIIRSLPIMFPTVSLMQFFVDAIKPIFEQLKILKRHNERLSTARDLLLPKLMGGEIAV